MTRTNDGLVSAEKWAKRDKSKWENLHLRDMPNFRFGVSDHPLPPKFRLFVEKKVSPRIELTGYKQDDKRELLA